MCYSDFGESRDKWRIVFYRYPIKSGFKRRSRNAFIQGIYYDSQITYTFPIAFPTNVLGASATGNLRCQLTKTAINITDMNVGHSNKQAGFVLSAGY